MALISKIPRQGYQGMKVWKFFLFSAIINNLQLSTDRADVKKPLVRYFISLTNFFNLQIVGQ